MNMYYRSGTAGRCWYIFALTRRQHFFAWTSWLLYLEILHQVKNPTPSVSAYFCEEHSCQISSRLNLKRRSCRLFWRARPTNKKKYVNKMSSDARSVPDLKKHFARIVKTTDNAEIKFPIWCYTCWEYLLLTAPCSAVICTLIEYFIFCTEWSLCAFVNILIVSHSDGTDIVICFTPMFHVAFKYSRLKLFCIYIYQLGCISQYLSYFYWRSVVRVDKKEDC